MGEPIRDEELIAGIPEARISALRAYCAATLVAVGRAAYLVSKAVRVALADLGMGVIHEVVMVDMPVVVAVDRLDASRRTRPLAQDRRMTRPPPDKTAA